jgi:hypothetical protein
MAVAVVDDTIRPGPGLPASFLLAPYLERPEEVPRLDFYLSGQQDADAALDLLLGTRARAGKASCDGAPALVDNLAQLRAKYEADLAVYRTMQTRTLYGLIALSFFGGLGLALGMTILGVLGAASGARLWVPGLLAAASCLVGGGVVRDASWHQSVDAAAVAYASFSGPTADTAAPEDGTKPGPGAKGLPGTLPATGEYAWRRPPSSPGGPAESPAVLYWNPRLTVGRDGCAKIGFDLPEGSRGYRILVEAHGEGRLGSAAIPLGHGSAPGGNR